MLKALGFGRRLIFGTLLAEAVILSALGGALGALAALGLTQLSARASDELEPVARPARLFIVTETILVQGLFLALFIGMLSGVVPAFGAARRSVAATLREVF